ncbi:MAG TPA: acyl-CoA carboxylase epsilon subunit [Actinotalea sp.]|nr:acyl-CoA carboxylase epsilon subunit [Actinotalea sp.]
MTPEVRVVRGTPDEIELAALVAGLAAGASAGAAVSAVADLDERTSEARRRWRTAVQRFGGGPETGGDAWRWSLR